MDIFSHRLDPSPPSERAIQRMLRASVLVSPGVCEGDESAGADQHAHATAWITRRICIGLKLGDQAAATVSDAARRHDAGKRCVPKVLLEKSTRLDEAETVKVQQHVHWGARLVSADSDLRSPAIRADVAVALLHHERWDGSGYPFGLAGEQIPLVARIVAIADVYDALISARSYKPAWTHEEAVAYIVARRGVHFDPQCVDAFVETCGSLPLRWKNTAYRIGAKRLSGLLTHSGACA